MRHWRKSLSVQLARVGLPALDWISHPQARVNLSQKRRKLALSGARRLLFFLARRSRSPLLCAATIQPKCLRRFRLLRATRSSYSSLPDPAQNVDSAMSNVVCTVLFFACPEAASCVCAHRPCLYFSISFYSKRSYHMWRGARRSSC